MSTKTKGGLFSRKKHRNSDSVDDHAVDGTHEPNAPATPEFPRSPGKAPATTPTAGTSNSAPHQTAWRGADAINADGAKHIDGLRNSTREGVQSDLNKDVGSISPDVGGLLTPGGKGGSGKGDHFLEDPVQKLHTDFLDKWKTDLLFPSIKQWVDTHISPYIENVLRKRTDAITAKYEAALADVEERHRNDVIDLENRHKELLTSAVTRTWAQYEKKMQDSRIMREVHFGFTPSSEHEPWSDGIDHVVPDIKNHVPKVYSPNVQLHEPGNHQEPNRLHERGNTTPPIDEHDKQEEGIP
jgi:hypothetical protein